MSRQSKKAKKADSPETASSLPYQVDMTASAEGAYKEMARLAKAAESASNYASAHCTTFNMVRDAIKRIIPADPLNRSYALRGDLSNIFRLRKGRLRICWIASSKIKRVCILFISETLRKEGDRNDPYEIFKSLLSSGTFDEYIKRFTVRIPPSSKGSKSNPSRPR